IGKRFRIEFKYKEVLEVPKAKGEQNEKAITKEWLTQWFAELDAIDEKLDPADFPRMEWGREMPIFEGD
ncbi:MAG: hypothetical protein LBE35_04550, partial [Clostridiales bacterium]|nr:hypothetical protein [Clostridiales bacterium]